MLDVYELPERMGYCEGGDSMIEITISLHDSEDVEDALEMLETALTALLEERL